MFLAMLQIKNNLKPWETTLGIFVILAATMGPTGWFLAHVEEYMLKEDDEETEE